MNEDGKLNKFEKKRLVEGFGVGRLKSRTLTDELNEGVEHIVWKHIDGVYEDSFQSMTRHIGEHSEITLGEFMEHQLDFNDTFEAVEELDEELLDELREQAEELESKVLNDEQKSIVEEMNRSIKSGGSFRRHYDDFEMMIIDTFWKEFGEARFNEFMKSLEDKVNALKGIHNIEVLAPSINSDESGKAYIQSVVKQLCWEKGRTL